jgi:malonyl-CoA O-methyltransferase
MKVKKKLVENNFSKRSEIYGDIAVFQQYAANKLFDCALKALGSKKPRRILELGCGTGFLTRKILEAFPDSEFEICDISQKMLDKCKENTLSARSRMEKDQVLFKCGDLDLVVDGRKNEFDLVISALTFQWIEKLLPVIRSAYKSLVYDGFLIFSSLADGTFDELRDVFGFIGEKYPGPEFLTLSELSDICSDFEEVNISTEIYEESFECALDFLRQVQMTGAGNATGRPVSPKTLRKVLALYPENEKGGVFAKYNLVICLAEKH